MSTLAPSGWPPEDRDHWWEAQSVRRPGNPVAGGSGSAIATAHNALATRAGLEALAQGGSAVDAALTTALTQIVLGAGAVISLVGILGLVVAEPDGTVATLHCGWKTCSEELDPMTIPRGAIGLTSDPQDLVGRAAGETGRGVLVGGFLRGVEVAHRRFGRLPFARLFEPAIELADEGFCVGEDLAMYIRLRGDDLRRLPATADVFVRSDGELYTVGDHFRQPALAATLRVLASDGAAALYEGSWAAQCVEAVSLLGGRLTLEDLASYEATWTEPVRTRTAGVELALLGGPCAGSTNLAEALHLADAAGLTTGPPWYATAQGVRDLIRATGAYAYSLLPGTQLPQPLVGLERSEEARRTRSAAGPLWKALKGLEPARTNAGGSHSDAVSVVDSDGMIATLTHSSNSMVWGPSTLMVAGVSVHDPGTYLQAQVSAVGPGSYVPSPLEVGVVLRDGVPALGFASMNMGLHQKTVGTLINVLHLGMEIGEANDGPAIGSPEVDLSEPAMGPTRVTEGHFPDDVLAELDVRVLPTHDAWLAEGQWVAVFRDSEGHVTATSPPHANGQAAAT